jgi:hypothetical protein
VPNRTSDLTQIRAFAVTERRDYESRGHRRNTDSSTEAFVITNDLTN